MVRTDERRRGCNLIASLLLLLAVSLLTCYVESAPGASDLRRRPATENSKLHIAVKSGNRLEVERLLDEGADVEAKPFDMYSAPPLHFAALAGDLELVRLLLDRGASVDSKELRHGSTALHVASSRGHTEIVRHLLQRGAQVNVKNKERGHTPLHEAARGGESICLISAG
jgi:ankyrin repeat protein